jgi:DNA-directed RNA polymerase subunit beta
MKQGLREAFEAISPITDFTGRLSLELEFDPDDMDLKSPPKFTVEECRQRATTYSQPIFVRARFLNSETGEIKEQTVFMGDFPIMTEQGTFIINGTERVVVSQLVRSPGVLFQPGKDEKVAFEGTIHPSRGEWLQVDLEEKKNKAASAGARIARKRRISIFTLLRALDTAMDEPFFERFVAHFDFLEDQFHADWKKAHLEISKHMDKYNMEDSPESFLKASQETAWLEIYRRARPGEVQTIEAARQYFEGAFFSESQRMSNCSATCSIARTRTCTCCPRPKCSRPPRTYSTWHVTAPRRKPRTTLTTRTTSPTVVFVAWVNSFKTHCEPDYRAWSASCANA